MLFSEERVELLKKADFPPMALFNMAIFPRTQELFWALRKLYISSLCGEVVLNVPLNWNYSYNGQSAFKESIKGNTRKRTLNLIHYFFIMQKFDRIRVVNSILLLVRHPFIGNMMQLDRINAGLGVTFADSFLYRQTETNVRVCMSVMWIVHTPHVLCVWVFASFVSLSSLSTTDG